MLSVSLPLVSFPEWKRPLIGAVDRGGTSGVTARLLRITWCGKFLILRRRSATSETDILGTLYADKIGPIAIIQIQSYYDANQQTNDAICLMLSARIVSRPRHAIIVLFLRRRVARPPKPNGVFVVAETTAAAVLTGRDFLVLVRLVLKFHPS